MRGPTVSLRIRRRPARGELRSARGRALPRWGNLRRLRRFSDRYGYDRGTPIERDYIERFLSEHAQLIRGSVLEELDVADPHVPLVACACAEMVR